MDISVSRLNNRMVLQVPPELPLGLVFVVGSVRNLSMPGEGSEHTSFELEEAAHSLHCRLSRRVAEEVLLKEGDTVRVGGHLAFDTQIARYYLLARDLEVVPDISASRTKMAPILADIKKRAEAAALVRTELPQWVKRLAPPEVQAELGLVEEEAEPADGKVAQPTAEPLEPGTDLLAPIGSMPDEMVSFLSDAMDQSEEVELTPEVLAQFFPLQAQERATPAEPDAAATGDPASAPEPAPQPAESRPVPATTTPARVAQSRQSEPEPGWLRIALLLFGLLLVILLVVAAYVALYVI